MSPNREEGEKSVMDMTREEAIKILKFERGYICDFKGCQEQQAFTMAIKALEQESKIDEIMAEIKKCRDIQNVPYDADCYSYLNGVDKCLEIINRYKSEVG